MKKKEVEKKETKCFVNKIVYRIFEISGEGHLRIPMQRDWQGEESATEFYEFGYDNVEDAQKEILQRAQSKGYGGCEYIIVPVYSAEEKLF